MNNPNPFVPKGSLLEQQSQRRSRLKITVGCVLTVSVLSLVVMLIQGCKREQPAAAADNTPPVDTNPPVAAAPGMPDNTSNLPPTGVVAPPAIPVASTTTSAPVIPTVPPPASAPMAPMATSPMATPDVPAAASTYEVVAGDSLAKIAKKNGVTLKALEAANPGVDPKKLKIKQKLNIPAATAKADATGAPGAPEAAGETYVVKSGDNLIKIAKHHGVTVKALRAANPKMNTDHIKVGDKLNLPAKAEPVATNTTDTTSPVAPPMQPVAPTAPTPAPAH